MRLLAMNDQLIECYLHDFQPARYRDRSNEVFLDFEAFLLSSMRERSTLWIHSQVKPKNLLENGKMFIICMKILNFLDKSMYGTS